MERRAWSTVAAVLVMGSLAGCASNTNDAAGTPSPTSSAEADSNRQACIDFGNTSLELGTLITEGSDDMGQAAWRSRLDVVPDRFDKAYVQADGQIADRMNETIENLPDNLGSLALEADDYSSDIRRVYNACDAEGHPVDNFATLE
ncbi:hypothetical protein [Frigoribacterium sp. Leaf172]|uniref:hypothetical protein n=1 Tax=Frigoribacterium sp. Leaf172 TaxID=1736285 RepID=UPI000AE6B333|nr:hypothetical protein [Frigoribacterium sp. Leaf172]